VFSRFRKYKSDVIASGTLKQIDRDELLRLNDTAFNEKFSGRRTREWILTKVGSDEKIIVRPLLWEDSPSRCLRCSVVFKNKEHGLGQQLLDIREMDFNALEEVRERDMRGVALLLVDHVKILNPDLLGS
jgi:hypothetical protein